MDKNQANKCFNGLVQEYANWRAAHQDLSTYINPTKGQFSVSQNRGKMIDHQIILDDHATHSSRVLASGMQSGMASQSRPWFRLNLQDKKANKRQDVRVWLDEVTDRMRDVCSSSNVYDVFFSVFEELGIFGTGCAIILEDYDKVVRMRNFTAGEYYIACDSRGIVDTFGREFEMTVRQVIEMFGEENCSNTVQAAYKNKMYETKIVIRHLIKPNDTRDERYDDNNNMAYSSVYWEQASEEDKFLDTTGFHEFPVIAPRWDTVTTLTVYGYGPGWFALGNTKQLQKTALDKLLAQEKIHNPPMQEDSSVDGNSNYLPGGKTKTTGSMPNAGVKPAYQINPNLESFIQSMNELKQSIDKSFYVNVFLMMANFDKTNMTATEVAQREQENIMMMGPLLNRVNSEMLTVFLERLFGIINRNLLFPPAPQGIEGQDIKIEFVSILAQAQKAMAAVSIDRFMQRAATMMQVSPSVSDGINFDETLKVYSELEGVPAKIMNNEVVMQRMREQRAQAEQMQNNMAMANQGADTVNKLSNSPKDVNSVLDGLSKSAKEMVQA